MDNWKSIAEYEGIYKVSDSGIIKSEDMILPCGKNREHTRKGRVLKPSVNNKGYLWVYLYKNGKKKKYYVHRIVASAFVPNPNNESIVNHKDEDSKNNRASNLEWCNCKYNTNYGTCIEKLKRHAKKKKIEQIKDGIIVNVWPSLREMERRTGYSRANVSSSVKRCGTAYGYTWRFVL